MNQEQEFAKTLEEIKDLAKEQGGSITEEQVEEAFFKIGLKKEELSPIYEYLRQKKIGIGEPVNADDYLTKEDTDYLSIYLRDLNLLPVHSMGERTACFLSAMAGEREAKAKVIEIMLPDVVDIAKLYSGQGIPLEDLIGEGNVALSIGADMLGCLEKPEEVQGMLAGMVMEAMEALIEEETKAKEIDRKIVDRINRVAKEAKELSESLRRKITVEELIQETGISKKEIMDAVRFSGNKMEYFEDYE